MIDSTADTARPPSPDASSISERTCGFGFIAMADMLQGGASLATAMSDHEGGFAGDGDELKEELGLSAGSRADGNLPRALSRK